MNKHLRDFIGRMSDNDLVEQRQAIGNLKAILVDSKVPMFQIYDELGEEIARRQEKGVGRWKL